MHFSGLLIDAVILLHEANTATPFRHSTCHTCDSDRDIAPALYAYMLRAVKCDSCVKTNLPYYAEVLRTCPSI